MLKLQALEQLLEIRNDDDRRACLYQGKELAIRRKLNGLQASMELYYLSIKRKLASIQRVASELIIDVTYCIITLFTYSF